MRMNVFKFLIVIFSIVLIGCPGEDGGGNDPIITTGTLIGVVTDSETGDPLEGVRIVIFNANTNSPVGSALTTDINGSYSQVLQQGTYLLKLSAQGYDDIPVKNISPLPVTVVREQTVTYSVEMTPSSVANSGFISGNVRSDGNPVAGVLIVATDGVNGFSSVTDTNGDYAIFNVPTGDYAVKGWRAGFNSNEDNVTVVADTETPNVDLSLSDNASGTVDGQITFLSTQNIEVDVALTHPDTRETIPGLTTFTTDFNYTINNVPDGTHLARATFANDDKVMDPDWILKFGEPFVTVASDMVQRDFSVTGAVLLDAPTNPATNTQPLEITTTTPTFTWQPFPSANDYVVEVINSNGTVIWGGFNQDFTVRNVIIPSSQVDTNNMVFADFNFDGNATEPLEVGKIYRWRVFASKDDNQEALGWKLISVSEDQMGIIKIVN